MDLGFRIGAYGLEERRRGPAKCFWPNADIQGWLVEWFKGFSKFWSGTLRNIDFSFGVRKRSQAMNICDESHCNAVLTAYFASSHKVRQGKVRLVFHFSHI